MGLDAWASWLQPGPNETEENGIYTGDAMELAGYLQAESVDMVFCDPVYEIVEQYTWLVEQAQWLLKPDSALLAFCGGKNVARTQVAVENVGALDWVWNLRYTVNAKGARLRRYNLFTWTTDVFWFAKGKGYPHRSIPDTFISSGGVDGRYKWNKNEAVYTYWLTAFTRPGDVIWDPFCGSGTLAVACKKTGRRYIGFEIEPGVAEKARKRVAQTAVPLLIRNAEVWQPAFDLEGTGA